MHETTLQILDIRTLPVNEGEDHLVLAMLTGLQTPFAGPDGQPVVLPTGVYKIPLTKPAAQELLASLSEAVDALPDPKRPSNIVVPGSPADIDRVAQNLKKFTES